MPFREDHDAALARAEALEVEAERERERADEASKELATVRDERDQLAAKVEELGGVAPVPLPPASTSTRAAGGELATLVGIMLTVLMITLIIAKLK